jgi:hypothetical protein
MPCLRFDLHRLFPLYLDGEAPARTVERIERHLLDCGVCRAQLVRLREAKTLLGELPMLEAPSFERVMSRASAPAERKSFVFPSLLRHFAADALVATILFAAFALVYAHTASARNRPIDWSSFRQVAIRGVDESHDPHVIVQGVVSELPGEFDEGSHRFRLSDPKDPGAFVVCEILDGDPLTLPKAGDRVRLWGVSRYDANPDHQWFEIHPVLKVEALR